MADQNLTAEELKNLQELNQKFNSKKMNIGDVVYQQALLVGELDAVRKEFSVLEADLVEKYGANAIIDLANGSVKYPEAEEVTDTPLEVIK